MKLTEKQIVQFAYDVDATRAHELPGDSLTIFKQPQLAAYVDKIIDALHAEIERRGLVLVPRTPYEQLSQYADMLRQHRDDLYDAITDCLDAAKEGE